MENITTPTLQSIAIATVTGEWLKNEMSTHNISVFGIAQNLEIPQSTIYSIISNNLPANSQARKVKLALYLHFKLLDYERRMMEE